MEHVTKLLDQIEDSEENAHAYRIRRANEAIDVLHGLIAREVHLAINAPKGSRRKLSWAEIAQALGISKSAAFARYGKK